LERDKFSCTKCGARCNLEVHHLIYISGREPWQYRDTDLITLCSSCHETWHGHTGSYFEVERGKRAVVYPSLPQPLERIVYELPVIKDAA
jgi:5-methylcytosine-specific restriction endonuclease McrA